MLLTTSTCMRMTIAQDRKIWEGTHQETNGFVAIIAMHREDNHTWPVKGNGQVGHSQVEEPTSASSCRV